MLDFCTHVAVFNVSTVCIYVRLWTDCGNKFLRKDNKISISVFFFVFFYCKALCDLVLIFIIILTKLVALSQSQQKLKIRSISNIFIAGFLCCIA